MSFLMGYYKLQGGGGGGGGGALVISNLRSEKICISYLHNGGVSLQLKDLK